MEASACMETPAAVEASAEARSSSRGKGPRCASVIEAAERARRETGGPAAMVGPIGAVTERRATTASAVEATVIAKLPTVRDVWVIAVHQAVSMPIRSPVVPAPAEAAEESDTDP